MQVWVAIRAHGRRVPFGTDRWVRAHAGAFVPFEPVGHHHWTSPSKTVQLFSWDDGPAMTDASIAPFGDDGAVTAAGHLHDRGTQLSHHDLAGRRGDPDRIIGDLGGAFSVCRAAGDTVQAWSSRGRTYPVFYASTPKMTVVASRPLAAHLVSRRSTTPEYDEQHAAELLACGLVAPFTNPFVGVRQLADGARLDVTAAGPTTSQTWEPPPGGDGTGAIEETVHALVESLAVLRGQTVRSAITGGKDSRLIAALLVKAGIDFSTFTTGAPEHPDVVVGAQVAAALGLEHETRPPADQLPPDPDQLIERLVRPLRSGEAIAGAYHAGGRPGGVRPQSVGLGGAGGEVLRGGFARTDFTEPDRLQRKLAWETRVNDRWLTPDASSHCEHALAAWFAPLADVPVPDVLAWYHRDIRLGRWQASRTMTRFGSPSIQPFLDSQVIRTAMNLPILDRASERSFYALLEHTNPDLAAMPLATSTWRFDVEKKKLAFEREADDSRHLLSGPIGRRLFEVIDDSSARDRLASVVDADAYESFRANALAGTHDGRERPSLFVWSLAMLSLMWDGTWLNQKAAAASR